MKKIITTIALYIAIATFVFANDTVIVKQDARIDVLIDKLSKIYRRLGWDSTMFRVQVLSTNDKATAEQMRDTLETKFPEVKIYIEYLQPYFKVRMGNFLDQSEATHLCNFINETLSNSKAYVITEKIDAAPTDTNF